MRYALFIGMVLVGLIGLWVYFSNRIPPGVTPQSDSGETIAWVGLATAIVSLLIALADLAKKLIDFRSNK